MEKLKEMHKNAMEFSLNAYKRGLGQKQNDEKIQKLKEEIEEKEVKICSIYKIRKKINFSKKFQQEIAKMKSEKEEIGDRESKALANAKKYELKWAEANEEIGTLRVS